MQSDIGTASWYDDKNALFLVINAQLPSLNEYVGKCRANAHVGAKFKNETEEVICAEILQSRAAGILRAIRPEEYPLQIEILWRESSERRDVDNIKSAAKFIMDALKKSGIIEDDGQKYVRQIYDRVTVNKKKKTAVFVKFIPASAAKTKQKNL